MAKQESIIASVTNNERSPEEYERLARSHDSYSPFWLTETIQLGPLLPSDKESLLEYLNDSRVYQWLLGPPYPYTEKDADLFIKGRVDRVTKNGTPLHLVFRDMTKGGKAIGSVGVSDDSDDMLDGDDVGYWLAPEYHGKGLMAKALKVQLRRVAIQEVGKRKFNAHAFVGNWASRKTMEKAGFVYQPNMEKTKTKDGKEIELWTMRMYLDDKDVENYGLIPEATPLPSLI
ncbi:hypothetical protein BX616_003515 [Lobosporangium transversale]|uniref:Acyl-CoA N-acyltransferase n=1 Tax=Lobosporangium transversale TaxID=64571 RepID=A0A1Y2GU28_9FUNG|nr:acyl-CoA N-acyltransferase [Lobosporangium transversale]KAF9916543.1 hypothetical protein BX616_003515 [Lobosporangium transversale]ORZ23749.1 acyl-CoA N-acyltransferase [Lobosporangium transversale]|eukprot:XP_021883563.1 acyl-CoA N-acyltransferase [Lobosporangium transversale]